MIRRFAENPIIHAGLPGLGPDLGANINGPSLVRVPPWLPHPRGRYYLYFAHHQGAFIRLAYADALAGPWHIHAPGTLHLGAIQGTTGFHRHIASPDVHVDEKRQHLRMYFHAPYRGAGQQLTGVAASADGLNFSLLTPEPLGPFYFRVFRWRGEYYAVAKYKNDCGQLLRSPDGLEPFSKVRDLIPNMRHAAVLVRDETLYLFYTVVGEAPERILLSRARLTPDSLAWKFGEPVEVARPQEAYEGTGYPLEPSRFGAQTHVQQLRDPCIFTEGERVYLLYAVAGEGGIAIAELELP